MTLENLIQSLDYGVSGIYKITSPSGKVYIGQSICIRKRFETYRKCDCPGQPRLLNSFKKYGSVVHKYEIKEKREVIDLNTRERYWQEFYDVLGENGLNCKLVSTEDKPCVHSEETKLKIGLKHKGKKWSEKSRKKASETHKERYKKFGTRKGLKHSEEMKNKAKERMKGKHSGSSNPFYGRGHSEETRSKMRDAIKRRKELGIKVERKECAGSQSYILDTEIGIFYGCVKQVWEIYNITCCKSIESFKGMLKGNQRNRTKFIKVKK